MSQYTQPPQYPQQPLAEHTHRAPARHRNGQGTAALILGIVGLLAAPIPFVFGLGILLGLLAFILGLSGRRRVKRGTAGNRGVATSGVVLGILALLLSIAGGVLTVKLTHAVVNDISSSADTKKALSAGESAIYDDGLTVTVSTPRPLSPPASATGHAADHRAYQVTVVLENTAKKGFDAGQVGVKAWTGTDRTGTDRTTAPQITGGKAEKGFNGTIQPGRTVTEVLAFDAPATAKKLTVQVDPGALHGRTRWDLIL